MVISHKCSCAPCFSLLRNFCTHTATEYNHYKALGIKNTATQAEIKSAYYELSKKHHPDKNQGSEKSAKLFRDISTAYEILGNEKLRKQYDREQLIKKRFEDPNFRNVHTKGDYNDDVERIFYERMTSRKRHFHYGKTPYFDFDEWVKQHYTNQRKWDYVQYETVRRKRFTYEDLKSTRRNSIKYDTFFFLFVSIITTLSMLRLWHSVVHDRKK